MRRRCVFVIAGLALCCIARQAAGQEHQHEHQQMGASAATWTWTLDGNAFLGRNYQQRLFADYSAWESQNWFMLAANRQTGLGHLRVETMVSLEAFTMHDRGSPQLFQTGESYQRIPLVNFQHPHDLLMELGATYAFIHPRVTYIVGADLVGSPTLGPIAFMHRASARDNPQAPLIHHYLDSTHITPGVVRAGVEVGSLTFEASAFRGAEPDEDRLNIERPSLDSWAARVRWRRGPWNAQVSGGHLRQPEWFEPFDTTRLTASISFDGQVRSRPLAMILAWGENRQFNGFNGNVDGFLLEGDLRLTSASTIYGRTEVTAKEIFGVAPHPKEFAHAHWFSDVTAVTVGYLRDVWTHDAGRLGVGADVTVYRMAPDMLPVLRVIPLVSRIPPLAARLRDTASALTWPRGPALRSFRTLPTSDGDPLMHNAAHAFVLNSY